MLQRGNNEKLSKYHPVGILFILLTTVDWLLLLKFFLSASLSLLLVSSSFSGNNLLGVFHLDYLHNCPTIVLIQTPSESMGVLPLTSGGLSQAQVSPCQHGPQAGCCAALGAGAVLQMWARTVDLFPPRTLQANMMRNEVSRCCKPYRDST